MRIPGENPFAKGFPPAPLPKTPIYENTGTLPYYTNGASCTLIPRLCLIGANFKCEISLSYSPSPSPLPPGERVSKSPSLDGRGRGRVITY